MAGVTIRPPSSPNMICALPVELIFILQDNKANDLDTLGIFSLSSSVNIGDKYGERRPADSRTKGKQVTWTHTLTNFYLLATIPLCELLMGLFAVFNQSPEKGRWA